MTSSHEVEHLRKFHNLGERFQFIFDLEGVQSARVLHYAIGPGGCSIPNGLSVEEQRKIVAEYQAKWREESCLGTISRLRSRARTDRYLVSRTQR